MPREDASPSAAGSLCSAGLSADQPQGWVGPWAPQRLASCYPSELFLSAGGAAMGTPPHHARCLRPRSLGSCVRQPPARHRSLFPEFPGLQEPVWAPHPEWDPRVLGEEVAAPGWSAGLLRAGHAVQLWHPLFGKSLEPGEPQLPSSGKRQELVSAGPGGRSAQHEPPQPWPGAPGAGNRGTCPRDSAAPSPDPVPALSRWASSTLKSPLKPHRGGRGCP